MQQAYGKHTPTKRRTYTKTYAIETHTPDLSKRHIAYAHARERWQPCPYPYVRMAYGHIRMYIHTRALLALYYVVYSPAAV